MSQRLSRAGLCWQGLRLDAESGIFYKGRPSMTQLATIILAAGKGIRMHSDRPKVLHEVAGAAMIAYPIQVSDRLKAQHVVSVLGHGAKAVQDYLKTAPLKVKAKLSFVMQAQQLGTAHAVKQAEAVLGKFKGDVLVLYGDVPLLSVATLKDFIKYHGKEQNVLSVLSADMEDPTGYGRIIRDDRGRVSAIVEQIDATAEQRGISEINSGILLINAQRLFEEVRRIKKSPRKQEYYLTDLIKLLVAQGERVGAVCVQDETEVMGVNNRAELAVANEYMRVLINEHWLAKGVTLTDPYSTYIDSWVSIEKDVSIGPGCTLRGQSVIKSGSRIDVGCVIEDTRIGTDARIAPYSVLEASRVDAGAQIGPFAHLREGSHIGVGAKVGNFVETKKTRLGPGAKANHLTYLGNAKVGEKTNIGAGTITCNYDGVNKYETVIGAGSFIGSDTQLVAPLNLGKGSWVAAGTTVTKDLPAGALAISRTKQVNIKNWSQRVKGLKKKK